MSLRVPTLNDSINQSINEVLIYFFNFGHIHMLMFVAVVILIIFLVKFKDVCWCEFFGHVQNFRSYSFRHLELVMLTFLLLGGNFIVIFRPE